MANYVKTWSGPNQVAFTSSADQAVQYRQIVFAIINALKLSGWTVTRSSNGTHYTGDGTGGVADNIVSVADIAYGAASVPAARTWAYLTPPTGKGNPLTLGNALLIECDNAAADTTPQNVNITLCTGVASSGNTTTLPTISGFTGAVLALNVIPWTTAQAGSLCVWYTTDGDVTVMVKLDSVSNFRMWFHIGADANNAVGNYTLRMGGSSSSATDQITTTILTSSTNWRGLLASGAGNNTSVIAQSIPWVAAVNWSNGQEATTTGVIMRDIEINGDNSGTSARIYGLWVDVYGVPANTLFNQQDSNDNGLSAPFVPRTVGDIMMPCSAAIT